MRVTCRAPLIVVDFVTLILFGVLPVTSPSSLSLLTPQIILSTALSDVLFPGPMQGRRVPMGAIHVNGKVI
jgi:hypothetical protein